MISVKKNSLVSHLLFFMVLHCDQEYTFLGTCRGVTHLKDCQLVLSKNLSMESHDKL